MARFLCPQSATELYGQLSRAAHAAVTACPSLNHLIRIHAGQIVVAIEHAVEDGENDLIRGKALAEIQIAILHLFEDVLKSHRGGQIYQQQVFHPGSN